MKTQKDDKSKKLIYCDSVDNGDKKNQQNKTGKTWNDLE